MAKAKLDLNALEQAASGASNVSRENVESVAAQIQSEKRRRQKLKTIKVQVMFSDDEIAMIERAKDIVNISATSVFCRKYALDAARKALKEE
jgi:hypothetical protein